MQPSSLSKKSKTKEKKPKKKSRNKKAKTDEGAQALFDEIDREAENGVGSASDDGEDSDEGVGMTFRMDEFDDTNKGSNKQGQLLGAEQ